jgi:hypothetical protein
VRGRFRPIPVAIIIHGDIAAVACEFEGDTFSVTRARPGDQRGLVSEVMAVL